MAASANPGRALSQTRAGTGAAAHKALCVLAMLLGLRLASLLRPAPPASPQLLRPLPSPLSASWLQRHWQVQAQAQAKAVGLTRRALLQLAHAAEALAPGPAAGQQGPCAGVGQPGPSARPCASSGPVACGATLALEWRPRRDSLGVAAGAQGRAGPEQRGPVAQAVAAPLESPRAAPAQVLHAFSLLARLQEPKAAPEEERRVLVVTGTWERTFQKLHLLGLGASLLASPSPVLWVVVEAGGASPGTRSLLRGSGVEHAHLGAGSTEGTHTAQGRGRLELLLRLHGLRFVRDHRIPGRVVFADDSAVLSRAFLEEAQRVRVLGAAAVGILLQHGYSTVMHGGIRRAASARLLSSANPSVGAPLEGAGTVQPRTTVRMPVQAPVCRDGTVIGWHTFPHSPNAVAISGSMPRPHASKEAAEERGSLEWMGFILNAELLWAENDASGSPSPMVTERGAQVELGAQAGPSTGMVWPAWVRPWQEWAPAAWAAALADAGPLAGNSSRDGVAATPPQASADGPRLPSILELLVRDESRVEALGQCSGEVLAWWRRSEARPDSKVPPWWRVSLSTVVPARPSPW